MRSFRTEMPISNDHFIINWFVTRYPVRQLLPRLLRLFGIMHHIRTFNSISGLGFKWYCIILKQTDLHFCYSYMSMNYNFSFTFALYIPRHLGVTVSLEERYMMAVASVAGMIPPVRYTRVYILMK